jgi:FixJ family two-component response regulator
VSDAAPYIAVVDDEEPVRTMIGRLLRLEDYQVASFGSGEEFLTSLVARVPACVILDVHMPGLSGLDVQAKLRAIDARVPAIFITASDDGALDRAVREAQGLALLRKPFSRNALLGAVTTALQGKPRGAS